MEETREVERPGALRASRRSGPAHGRGLPATLGRPALCTAALLVAALVVGGCEAEPWDTVASQAIPHGVVRLWAADGRLHPGSNDVLVDVVGPAAGDRMIPPRLVFEKPQAAAGYGLRAEAILRAAGRARFRGRVEFPEPGAWTGRLEVDGETVAIDVAVD
jgi:hypothetical protein